MRSPLGPTADRDRLPTDARASCSAVAMSRLPLFATAAEWRASVPLQYVALPLELLYKLAPQRRAMITRGLEVDAGRWQRTGPTRPAPTAGPLAGEPTRILLSRADVFALADGQVNGDNAMQLLYHSLASRPSGRELDCMPVTSRGHRMRRARWGDRPYLCDAVDGLHTAGVRVTARRTWSQHRRCLRRASTSQGC